MTLLWVRAQSVCGIFMNHFLFIFQMEFQFGKTSRCECGAGRGFRMGKLPLPF